MTREQLKEDLNVFNIIEFYKFWKTPALIFFIIMFPGVLFMWFFWRFMCYSIYYLDNQIKHDGL